MYVESYDFYQTDSFIYLLLMCYVVLPCNVFVLRSYVCFVVPRFFCLHRLPTYVEPPVFSY